MADFKAPVEDILFSLNHVARVERLSNWDGETAEAILTHFADFAEGELAPLNAKGDTQGARFENGRVRMPDGFGAAYAQLADGGWQGLGAPEEFGGMAQPAPICAGVSEIFSGANVAFQMVCGLVPGAINTLLSFGTQAQQTEWIPKLAEGTVLSTMCLTEPAAGSDLSAIRCRATAEGAEWRITGEKIFISGGDQDMSEGIAHLVLARTRPVDAGLKGLSLFLCPQSPEVKVTRIEEKMGLHASPTCQLAFDGARAELLGQEGDGLRAMFTVMNHARLDVALQGVAAATRASHVARTYAQDRKQGRRADGSPAILSDHPDVHRMLAEQTALAMGARAMCHVTMVELALNTRPALVNFLTPLCKVFASEAGIRAADLGIQVLGGYGYLTEYHMSQIWRDARISAIYEGANGIHTRNLATRQLKGEGAEQFEELIGELAGTDADVAQELSDWRGFRDALREDGDALIWADAFAKCSGRVFLKACWAKIESHLPKHFDAENLRFTAKAVRANFWQNAYSKE